MTPLLELHDVDAHYGDFQALFGVSLTVERGGAVAVVGANGAGKSTLLNTIAGLLRPSRGELRYDGRDIAGRPAHRRVADGIALVPEGRRLFASLTLEENLLAGGYPRRPGRWSLPAVYQLFPWLSERRDRPATALSGGEQQAVAIGRALMANPRLLLLDEVSLGLAPVVVKQLYAALPAITEDGTSVVVVEQDLSQALAIADHVYCLLEGRVALSGDAARVELPELVHAYFGTAGVVS